MKIEQNTKQIGGMGEIEEALEEVFSVCNIDLSFEENYNRMQEKAKEVIAKQEKPQQKSNPVMYIFINKGLNLSPGKMAAQASHAAVKASDGSDPKMREDWNKFGFYTKLIMEARDAEHIKTIERYLNERGIKTFIIIDEGRTEIKAHQITALGVEVVDKNKVGEIFQEFSLFKPSLSVNIKWNE